VGLTAPVRRVASQASPLWSLLASLCAVFRCNACEQIMPVDAHKKAGKSRSWMSDRRKFGVRSIAIFKYFWRDHV
jgi:hypothetical protein